MADFATVEVAGRDGWRAWLKANYGQAASIWLVIAKKGSGADAPGYEDAVLEALAWGWIDSRPGRVDQRRYKVLMSPRKPGSVWSAINKARVERLVAEGRMAAPGLAKVEAAKSDGSWEALDMVEAELAPAALGRALDARPGARVAYEGWPPRVRKNALQWIAAARSAGTRARRIEETAACAARGERPKR